MGIGNPAAQAVDQRIRIQLKQLVRCFATGIVQQDNGFGRCYFHACPRLWIRIIEK